MSPILARVSSTDRGPEIATNGEPPPGSVISDSYLFLPTVRFPEIYVWCTRRGGTHEDADSQE